MSTKLISEIGINHNGDMDLAKKLISMSAIAGFDFVKIQKRDPDICVPERQKSKRKITPWGEMSYLEYKKRIEFNEEQIRELQEYSTSQGIKFFSSVWDIPSTDLMARYCDIGKIPSALITDLELCRHARAAFKTLIISTGMSSEQEIRECIDACDPDVVMHTNSTYPCPPEDLNLRYIEHLRTAYPGKQIGYSGHEYGLVTTFAAVAMGVEWVERHVTLDRSMWGSDQGSSIEPSGMMKLVKGIRDIECAQKFPAGPRIQFKKEAAKRESLRPT